MDLIEIPLNELIETIYEDTLRYNTEISKEYPDEKMVIFQKFYRKNLKIKNYNDFRNVLDVIQYWGFFNIPEEFINYIHDNFIQFVNFYTDEEYQIKYYEILIDILKIINMDLININSEKKYYYLILLFKHFNAFNLSSDGYKLSCYQIHYNDDGDLIIPKWFDIFIRNQSNLKILVDNILDFNIYLESTFYSSTVIDLNLCNIIKIEIIEIILHKFKPITIDEILNIAKFCEVFEIELSENYYKRIVQITSRYKEDNIYRSSGEKMYDLYSLNIEEYNKLEESVKFMDRFTITDFSDGKQLKIWFPPINTNNIKSVKINKQFKNNLNTIIYNLTYNKEFDFLDIKYNNDIFHIANGNLDIEDNYKRHKLILFFETIKTLI